MPHRLTFPAAIVLVGLVWFSAAAQQPLVLKQVRDGMPTENLTTAELATLGDPFFELVLKTSAGVPDLAKIEDLIQPLGGNRLTFVVDENIASSARPQQRRAVFAYTGSNSGHVLETNVMLSVAFSSENFTDTPRFIEAWGWDNDRGRYNYYKLDRTGTPDQRMTWKFRGSSDDADLLSASDREGTCMACHINGAPLMKELAFPWNNWHSFESVATYLTAAAPANVRWPVTTHPRLSGRLRGAEDLETGGVLPSITQFNNRRINRQLARSDVDGNLALEGGRGRVLDAPRLLRPLFVTTEANAVSARQKSGLHPIPKPSLVGPAQDIVIPNAFFLNANLISGGTPAQYVGLGIKAALEFRNVAKVTAAEYKDLVVKASLTLAGKEPADADFAWFTPEPSHIDNDMADRLMRRGILTPEFVAAVQLVDLEAPVFSEARARLLRFVPKTFTFQPLAPGSKPTVGRHPDELAKAVIQAAQASSPAAGSPELLFIQALENAAPVALLEQRVKDYQQRLSGQLQNQGTRQQELQRLFQSLINRRVAFLTHEVLGPLDETGDRLFPVPANVNVRPARGSGGQIK